MNNYRRSQGSFMLEFLVALVIFSICLIGLVRLQNASLRNLADNRDSMANGFLLEDAIARVDANFTNANFYTGNGSGNVIAAKDITEVNANAKQFNRKVNFSYIASTKKVTIAISTLNNGGSSEAKDNDALSYSYYPRQLPTPP